MIVFSESQQTPEETDFNSIKIRGIVMLVIQQHDADVLQEFLSWKIISDVELSSFPSVCLLHFSLNKIYSES